MKTGNMIFLHNKTEFSFTQVSNTFIDEYMPEANGTYIKVYLTLLRLINDSHFNISISSIADALDLTEKHVNKALSYWDKKGLLSLTLDEDDNIMDITFHTPVKNLKAPCHAVKTGYVATDNSHQNEASSDRQAPENKTADTAADAGSYSTDDIKRITGSEEFASIIGIIENYMQRTLTPSDIELVVYLYESLKFSYDLIFYLYEYCINKGKKNTSYIQKVAANWAAEGIDTVEKAIAHSAQYDTNYIQIMKAFGLNQAPAPAQKQYIDSWLADGFSPDVITEACNRTIIATGKPSFKYANGIIENWKRNGLKALEDIKTADTIHNSVTSGNAAVSRNTKVKKHNSFTSYEQRDYTDKDYKSLEQKLLNS